MRSNVVKFNYHFTLRASYKNLFFQEVEHNLRQVIPVACREPYAQ